MSTNIDVASSPLSNAHSPALSHTRFNPRDMNSRRRCDSAHDVASKVATYASTLDARSSSNAACVISKTTHGGALADEDEDEPSPFGIAEYESSRFPTIPIPIPTPLPPSTSSSAVATRSVSCRGLRVRNALPPMSRGPETAAPRAPFPAGHGTASARATPDNSKNTASASSPSW